MNWRDEFQWLFKTGAYVDDLYLLINLSVYVDGHRSLTPGSIPSQFEECAILQFVLLPSVTAGLSGRKVTVNDIVDIILPKT